MRIRILLSLTLWLMPVVLWAAPSPQLRSFATTPVASTTPQTITIVGARLQVGLTATIGTTPVLVSALFVNTNPQTFKITYVFAEPGSVILRVKNPDGKVSNGLTITVASTTPAPMPEPVPVPTPTPTPTPTTTRGPQASITCPAGSLNVLPGADIRAANAANLSVCLKAGTHNVTYEIVPRSGSTFTCEYGATLDGKNMSVALYGREMSAAEMDNTAMFKAVNLDIDDVVIRNCTIVNVPGFGIVGFYTGADRWTIDHSRLAYNKRAAVSASNGGVVSNTILDHNVGDPNSTNANENGAGYLVFRAKNVLFVDTEIAYNGGGQQKSVHTENVTFRRVFVHHNAGNGVWFDGDNPGCLVEDSLFEDNTYVSIVLEISSRCIIRRNTIRRSGWEAIALQTSKEMDVSFNTIEDSGRGIGLQLSCIAPLGGGTTGWDLANNILHDNTIRVGTASGNFANSFGWYACTADQLVPYLNGQKNNRFVNNTYLVPNVSGAYWRWNTATMLTFAQWQALGQDTTGTVR